MKSSSSKNAALNFGLKKNDEARGVEREPESDEGGIGGLNDEEEIEA